MLVHHAVSCLLNLKQHLLALADHLAWDVTRDLRSGQPMLFISRRLWSGQIDAYQHDFPIQSQQTIVPTGRRA